MEELKLIFCIWEDITSGEIGWKIVEEAQDWSDTTDSHARQVGFLVSKDDDYLVLTCSYIKGLDLIGEVVRIPTPSIKLIKEITIDQSLI